MKVEVRKSFEKDISKIADSKLAHQLYLLVELLEQCKSLTEIQHLKKMQGNGGYYRIRMGNYRLGLKVEKDTILLLRFMHRKDIYNYFP